SPALSHSGTHTHTHTHRCTSTPPSLSPSSPPPSPSGTLLPLPRTKADCSVLFEKVIGCNLPSLQEPEVCREDYGRPLPPWTQTPCDTQKAPPLRQKAAIHQTQNLNNRNKMPPEQLLPVCGWPHQQGLGTHTHTPDTDSFPFNIFCKKYTYIVFPMFVKALIMFIVYCVSLLFEPLYHKEFLVGENL